MYENNKWEFPVTFNYGNELKINNGCVLKGSAFGFQVKDKNDKVVVEFKLSFTDDCNTYMVSSVKDALGFGGTETGYIVLSATEDRGNKAPVLVDAYYPDKGEAVTSLYDTAFPVFFSNTTEQGRKLPSDEKEIIIDESKKITAYNNNNNVPLSDFVTLNPNNDVFDFNDISFVPPPKEEWDDFEITGTNELKLLNSDDTWAKHSKTANTSNDFRPRFLACAPSSVAPDITNSLFITMLGESIFKDLNFGGLYEFGLTIEDFPNVISPIQTLSETEYTCGYIYDYTNKKWLYTGFWAKLQQLKIYQISTVSTSPTVVTLPLQPSIAFPSYGGTTIIDLPEDATVTMVGYFHPDDIKLGSEEDQLSPEELESDTTGKKKTDINQACKITAGEAGTTITFTGDTGYSSELKQFTVSLYGSSNRVEANAFVLWKYERPNYETYYSLTSINIYQ